MNKTIIALFVSFFFAFENSTALSVTKVYSSKFVPREVTFNGSPNPHECWESVANGIEIKTEEGLMFFAMSFKMTDSLETIIGDSVVQIEVYYYAEPDDRSGVNGEVLKITMGDVVIFKRD